ncbi:SOS response-associated peptidase family protein [Gelidibacter gilvus]|uniref:Abasic site processing protein n=1 Tax=Gelidibacter gilvus TaxID=59602 RepID=A0A4Q0XDG2_9FLAO|nr:SOS response-associated peptidase family protein [Gelidibacter gilvus]RXJ44360.1 hypothetical protein ESZ48_18345 [Gelidibacter gilvus]
MLSQISNTATKEIIEQKLHAKFDYGHLYKPQFKINGLKESILCIITSKDTDRIQFGIWGVLPGGYKDTWKKFQSAYNTLDIEFDSITELSWLYDALKHRRCLIVATGYFTTEIEHQYLQTFHNISKHQNLICFAGIYNILEDGFISCGILTQYDRYSKYLLKNPKPIIIKEENYNNYLNSELSLEDILDVNFEIHQKDILQLKISKHELRSLKKRSKI